MLSRILQALVLIYQAVAVFVFIASFYLSANWLTNPFLGGFFEHTFILNGTGSDKVDPTTGWAMYQSGFVLNDQLVSINGIPVSNADQVSGILSTFNVGDTIPVGIQQYEGSLQNIEIQLQALTSEERYAFFYMPMFLSLVFLIVSLWTFGLRRTEPAGRAFSIFTTSLAIVVGAFFDLNTSHQFTTC
jgi:membrane-associated protease RseP (regulator of RpoE activity)